MLNGSHQLPLFRGEVPNDVLKAMESDLPETIFQNDADVRKTKMVSQ